MTYFTKVDQSTPCGKLQFNACMRSGLFALALAFFCLFAGTGRATVTMPTISQISIMPNSAGIKVVLDRPAPFRAVLVDSKEALIAFKNVQLSKKVQEVGENGALHKPVKIDRLPNDVVALVVVTTREMREIQASWDNNANTMIARFIFAGGEMRLPDKVRKKAFKKPENLKNKKKEWVVPVSDLLGAGQETGAIDPSSVSEVNATSTADAEVAPATAVDRRFELNVPVAQILAKEPASDIDVMKGDMDDLLLMMTDSPCGGKLDIQGALRMCKQKDWRQAFDLLNEGIFAIKEDACLERAYFLRAYAFYLMNLGVNEGLYPEVLNLFQESLSYYPSSVYAPFALTGMGKTYKALKNFEEAKGYFKIILDTHKEYSGKPEVLYELGRIYYAGNKPELSISIFKEFLAEYAENPLALDVTLELGTALYDLNRYSDALEMLNAVLAKDVRKAFENEKLLWLIGNCYYQLGKFEDARNALTKAVNLFPAAESNSTSLTRIGDTYRDTGQPEKASKIYQLAMDTYPKTDGFIIGAIRKAELLSDRSEKQSIFRMIIEGYSAHPMADLAVVKLADLYQNAGEYRNSIETIRPLVIARPNALIEEAVFIMQAAFEGLLSEMLKSDAYPEIVVLHQKDGAFFRRFNNPNIFKMLGEAYLNGHLHTEAATLLKKAAKLYGEDAPAELSYELAVALQAANETDLALTELNRYAQNAPEGDHVADAFCRMGRILIDRGEPENAFLALNAFYRQNLPASEKIRLLRLLSETHRLQGQYEQAADKLVAATDLLTAAPNKDSDALADIFQQLGEDYLQIKSYLKAIDAFTSALKYGGKAPSSRILVQLGEAYQKAGDTNNAKQMFDQVLTLEDDFWKYQAKERLQRLAIENRIGF
ncbi:MAG: tetratricopeptide repeat protein [Desulfobacterales bacterium]|jgi:tetratricopeptide (TPR) repeat protein|nr:tetratricopeptide repeat protein [Desulfobacterales bacterium]